MILPVIYAVTVWFFVARYRRRWPSVLILALAVTFLAGLGYLANGREMRGTLAAVLVLLWPYTALVGVIGLFIAVMPRKGLGEGHCAGCQYDLAGLPPLGLICPECGTAWCGPGSGLEAAPEELIPVRGASKPTAKRVR